MSRTHAIRAIGIAWFRNARDFQAIRAASRDGFRLPPSFAAWQRRAEQLRQTLLRQGAIVEQVYLDPGQFTDWCRTNGLDIDANARIRFASEAVARKYTETH